MERPITIAVLAIGGQGGGVLVDWIVALGGTGGLAGAVHQRARCGAADRGNDLLCRDDRRRSRARAGVFGDGRAGRRRYRYCRGVDGGRAGDPARAGDAGPDDADRLDPSHVRGVGEVGTGRRRGEFGRGDRGRAGGGAAVRGVRHGGAGGTGGQRGVVGAVRRVVRDGCAAVRPRRRSRRRSPRRALACRAACAGLRWGSTGVAAPPAAQPVARLRRGCGRSDMPDTMRC